MSAMEPMLWISIGLGGVLALLAFILCRTRTYRRVGHYLDVASLLILTPVGLVIAALYLGANPWMSLLVLGAVAWGDVTVIRDHLAMRRARREVVHG